MLFLSALVPLAGQGTDRISFGLDVVLPSAGSVTGTWFYEHGTNQLLLTGFPDQKGWRACAVGAGWHVNGDAITPHDVVVLPNALEPERSPYSVGPVKGSGPLDNRIATALVEWDWRLQDGLGVPREPCTFAEAVVPLRARFRMAGLAQPPPETSSAISAITMRSRQGRDAPRVWQRGRARSCRPLE